MIRHSFASAAALLVLSGRNGALPAQAGGFSGNPVQPYVAA